MKQEIERIARTSQPSDKTSAQSCKNSSSKASPPEGRRLTFRYLCSPTKVIANDAQGRVAARSRRRKRNDSSGRHGPWPRAPARARRIEVDCVIYAIGDQVDAALGLPFSRGAFVTNPEKLPGDPNPARPISRTIRKPKSARRHFRRRLVAQRRASVWSASPSRTPSAA